MWLSIRYRCLHTKLVLYRCSYISIRCFMYDATINLECNADRRVSVDLFSRRDGPGWRHAAPCCLKAQQQLELKLPSVSWVHSRSRMNETTLAAFSAYKCEEPSNATQTHLKAPQNLFSDPSLILAFSSSDFYLNVIAIYLSDSHQLPKQGCFVTENSYLSKNLEKMCIYELYS